MGRVKIDTQQLNRPKWLQGIRPRLFLTLGIILMIVGAGALYVFLSYEHKKNTSELHDRGEVLVDVQAIALRFPLWNLNKEQCQIILDMLGGADDFKGAKLFGQHNDLIAQAGAEYDPATDYKFSKHIFHQEGTENNDLGYIELYLNKTQLEDEFMRELRYGMVALLLVLFLMFISFWVSLSILVIQPLRELMSVIDHIAAGDFGRKLDISRADEFGNLAKVFNKMTSELSHMYKVIEQKVTERTAELTVSNKSLIYAQEKATKAAELLKIEKEKSERLLVDALEISPAAMILLDKDGRIVRWNQKIAQLDEQRLKGKLVGGSLFQPIFESLFQHTEENPHQTPFKILRAEEQLHSGRWIKITQHPTRDNYTALMFVDITDIKEREKTLAFQAEKLRQSEEKYALAAHGANDGLWDYNLSTGELYCSPRFLEMLGYEENSRKITTIEDWHTHIHPDELAEFKLAFNSHIKGMIPRFKFEHRLKHKNGDYVWALCRGLAAHNDKNIPIRIAGSLTDITVQKNYESELLHTAFHDPLTGLPNREFFIRRLAECIQENQKDRSILTAILFLDLDRFKVVNDSLGHDIGDKLLVGISTRIKKCLRTQDFAARLGGDEFTILVRKIPDSSEAEAVASRILDELRLPFHLDGHEVFASASIGITMLSDDLTDVDSLIRNADLAMYRAKTKGRSRFELFSQEMHTQVMNELKIETDLRRALEKNEILLHYQPIVDIVSNELVGFEGLMRWNFKHETMMNLGKFMPIAEVTGLILPMGEHIFELACQQLKEWMTMIGPDAKLTVATNLSVCQLRDPQYMRRMLDRIKKHNFPAGYLKIEVTESAIMEDLTSITDILQEMRDLGVQLCIDDFGTGYSSFSYLHKFPFDVLKVDQSFIQRMSESEKMVNMVRGIINLSHDLGLTVVAEGIETQQQLEFLKKLRCDYGQGYFFAKPMSPEEATKFIQQSRMPRTEHALIHHLMFPPDVASAG